MAFSLLLHLHPLTIHGHATIEPFIASVRSASSGNNHTPSNMFSFNTHHTDTLTNMLFQLVLYKHVDKHVFFNADHTNTLKNVFSFVTDDTKTAINLINISFNTDKLAQLTNTTHWQTCSMSIRTHSKHVDKRALCLSWNTHNTDTGKYSYRLSLETRATLHTLAHTNSYFGSYCLSLETHTATNTSPVESMITFPMKIQTRSRQSLGLPNWTWIVAHSMIKTLQVQWCTSKYCYSYMLCPVTKIYFFTSCHCWNLLLNLWWIKYTIWK